MNEFISKITELYLLKKLKAVHKISIDKFEDLLSSYCELRLKYLNNEDIKRVEYTIFKKAVQLGIKYALTSLSDGQLDTNTINELSEKIAEQIAPDIADIIHSYRKNVFEFLKDMTNEN